MAENGTKTGYGPLTTTFLALAVAGAGAGTTLVATGAYQERPVSKGEFTSALLALESKLEREDDEDILELATIHLELNALHKLAADAMRDLWAPNQREMGTITARLNALEAALARLDCPP